MTFLENVDKAKLQKILLITISALVLISLTLLLVIIVMSIEPSGPNSQQNIKFTDHTLTENDASAGSLILADAEHPYVLNEAVTMLEGCQGFRNEQMKADGIEVSKENYSYIAYSNMMLASDAMSNAHKMLSDANSAVKEKAIVIDGAYKEIINGDKTIEEYNTALLILLADYTSEQDVPVPLSDAYKAWFDKNAASYGFIESFEDGYRYVGVAHAKYMTEKKLSLASYISYLKENTSNEKGLTVKTENGTEYYIYYVAAKVGETVKIPSDANVVISGTNEGGIIVTAEIK